MPRKKGTQIHKLSRDLGVASTDNKCHRAIPWARSCQYQCFCKLLIKYSKRFKSYGHFSQTDRGQTTSQICDYRAHSESQPSASLLVDFLRVLQFLFVRNTKFCNAWLFCVCANLRFIDWLNDRPTDNLLFGRTCFRKENKQFALYQIKSVNIILGQNQLQCKIQLKQSFCNDGN